MFSGLRKTTNMHKEGSLQQWELTCTI
jgi:hypothetical protein